MDRFKKILLGMLCAGLCLSLAACGDGGGSSDSVSAVASATRTSASRKSSESISVPEAAEMPSAETGASLSAASFAL